MKILIKLCLIVIVLSGWHLSASAQRQVPAARMSPTQLVANLYRQHKRQSPFFQTKNRALVDRYFDKKLAELIWNMPNSPDEVGPLDGDPLYNAQDMDIKNFVVHPATLVNGTATVLVTFTNIGKKQEVKFLLALDNKSWKITNIKYDDGTDLVGILSSGQ